MKRPRAASSFQMCPTPWWKRCRASLPPLPHASQAPSRCWPHPALVWLCDSDARLPCFWAPRWHGPFQGPKKGPLAKPSRKFAHLFHGNRQRLLPLPTLTLPAFSFPRSRGSRQHPTTRTRSRRHAESGFNRTCFRFTPRLSPAITPQTWLQERCCRPGCSGLGLGDKVQAGPCGDMNSPSSAWCRGRVGLEKEQGWQCRGPDAAKSSQTWEGKQSAALSGQNCTACLSVKRIHTAADL